MLKNIGFRLRRRGLKQNKTDPFVEHIDRESKKDLEYIGNASKDSLKSDEKFWDADVKAQEKTEEASAKKIEDNADAFVGSFDPDKRPREKPVEVEEEQEEIEEEDEYADIPKQEVEVNVDDQPRHEVEEEKEVEKEAAEHPTLPKETVEQIVEDHEAKEREAKEAIVRADEEIVEPKKVPGEKGESVASVAGKNISDAEKAAYHRKQVVEELKKDKPDFDVIKFHRAESLKYVSKRPVFVPRYMVKK